MLEEMLEEQLICKWYSPIHEESILFERILLLNMVTTAEFYGARPLHAREQVQAQAELCQPFFPL